MLQFVDSNVLSETRTYQWKVRRGKLCSSIGPIWQIVSTTQPISKQLILAKELIDHATNVNAVSNPRSETPLHRACYSGNETNLDFVELLLKKGADPNTQDRLGVTPLMCTTQAAPGAARFLLNWTNSDGNIAGVEGAILDLVRWTSTGISDQIILSGYYTNRLQHQFLLQQWRDI